MSKAPNTVLVDTSILIDAAVPGRPQHDAAIMLENEVAHCECTAFIAATSLKDAYFLIKSASDAAFAREYIQCLMRLYKLAPVDALVCQEAAASDEPDFEDGIIRACAEGLNANYIISRDEAAFRASPTKRLSAQEYIDAHGASAEVTL